MIIVKLDNWSERYNKWSNSARMIDHVSVLAIIVEYLYDPVNHEGKANKIIVLPLTCSGQKAQSRDEARCGLPMGSHVDLRN